MMMMSTVIKLGHSVGWMHCSQFWFLLVPSLAVSCAATVSQNSIENPLLAIALPITITINLSKCEIIRQAERPANVLLIRIYLLTYRDSESPGRIIRDKNWNINYKYRSSGVADSKIVVGKWEKAKTGRQDPRYMYGTVVHATDHEASSCRDTLQIAYSYIINPFIVNLISLQLFKA